MTIVAVDAGFSRSRGFWARRIMSTTDSFWCHAFTRFRFSNGDARIFESRYTTRGFCESDSMHYDLDWLKLAKMDNGLEAVAFVPILEIPGDSRLHTALALCEQWIGAKPYPVSQLAWIWMSQRYGVAVPRSENALICSEALSVIANECGVDLRDEWHPTWDSVTPGSAWNNLMAIRAGFGSHIKRKEEVKVCGSGYSKYYSLRPRPR